MEDPTPYDPPNHHLHDGRGVVDGGVGLSVPPLDPNFDIYSATDDAFLSDDFPFNVDFDFTFDDLSFADNLLLDPNPDPSTGRVTSENPSSGEDNGSGGDEVRVYDCGTPEEANHGPISSEESNFGAKSRCDSPEIGSCKSNSGVFSGNCSDRDVASSLMNNSGNLSDDSGNSKSNAKLGEKIKVEGELVRNNGGVKSDGGVVKTKRKKEARECEERSSKFFRKSVEEEHGGESGGDDGGGEDSKRKARLMRNRESAQLSRQRKKQYVEELEDKVRAMTSTIHDLNGRISYFMAENVRLHQQLSSGGAAAVVPPPPPGMYPAPPMAYPWMMPCMPYPMKPQGSNVLVPIPRLKPQAPAPAPKKSGKGEGKKTTKKVASVSLLGLLFFMLLFGGLLPMVSVRYGSGGRSFGGRNGSGAVFMVDKKVGHHHHHGRALHESNLNGNGSIGGGNGSEPLVASLYVPRNDKMVKIDGNLIIHSVLASEKAMRESSKGERDGGKVSEETSLAIHGSSYPPYPTPGPGSNNWRRPHLDRNPNGRQAQKALGSGSNNGFTPVGSDGKLQEWFREGLAGPMLSSGMCTEVFQFDISPTPGSIVPASSINITSKDRQNSTHPNKPKNRRILHGSLDGHNFNITEEPVQPRDRNDGLQSNKSSSPMIVSVLVDPREVGDGDGEGVIRSKTLSRIFVVVLIDSVKYVTYSCMLPFMVSGSHLVTT